MAQAHAAVSVPCIERGGHECFVLQDTILLVFISRFLQLTLQFPLCARMEWLGHDC
jgi:hypothetical protein